MTVSRDACQCAFADFAVGQHKPDLDPVRKLITLALSAPFGSKRSASLAVAVGSEAEDAQLSRAACEDRLYNSRATHFGRRPE